MIIDSLSHLTHYNNIPGISGITSFLARPDLRELRPGDYPLDGDKLIAKISKYETHLADPNNFETHQKYIDVQVILSGCEKVNVVYQDQIKSHKGYNPASDADFHSSTGFISSFLLDEGHFMVFFPGEPHQPALSLDDKKQSIHKVVFKVSATLMRR